MPICLHFLQMYRYHELRYAGKSAVEMIGGCVKIAELRLDVDAVYWVL